MNPAAAERTKPLLFDLITTWSAESVIINAGENDEGVSISVDIIDFTGTDCRVP